MKTDEWFPEDPIYGGDVEAKVVSVRHDPKAKSKVLSIVLLKRIIGREDTSSIKVDMTDEANAKAVRARFPGIWGDKTHKEIANAAASKAKAAEDKAKAEAEQAQVAP